MDSVASPYPYALMLPQSDTERLLEERLQRAGVLVERSTEATALTIEADGVEATLRRADGREETVHAKGYLFPDTEVAIYWAREGVLPIFPISPGRYRIIANIPSSGGDHSHDPTLEEVQAIVEQRGSKGASLFDPI
jgi:FAD binding domain